MNDLGAQAALTDPRVRLTTAQALVRFLSVQSSERDGALRRLIPGLFGIFGHGNVVGLGQALEQEGRDLPYYQGKNEQAMVHAALGYAKATRRTATLACAGSVGPGSTNMLTGAATAAANRLPVLLLPADSFMHRRMDPVLQQLQSPIGGDLTVNDCFRPVSRFFDRVTRPEQLLVSLPEAMRVLTDPVETGPVTISLPQDVQGEAFEWPASFFTPHVWPIVRRDAATEEVARATAVLAAAERPLIIVGGGVRYSEAEAAVARLVATHGIPVAETFAGKGCGPDHPLNLGAIGATGTLAANRVAATADVILAIGTRLQDFTTGSHALFQNPELRIVSINVAPSDAHRMNALPVVGDARSVVERLASDLDQAGVSTSPDYRAEVESEQEDWRALLRTDLTPRTNETFNQAQVVERLNLVTGHGDVIVAAAGSPPADIHRMWDPSNGAECHIEFGFSCMGHEIPAGLGYRLARPEDPGQVFVFIGDGTYLMNNTELVTAVQEGLRLTVVIIENGGYQAIRSLQVGKTAREFGNEFRARESKAGRLEGEYLTIDYAANAASLGCAAFCAETLEEFEAAVAKSREIEGPSVIVVPVERHRLMSPTECFWDVGIAQVTSADDSSALSREHQVGQGTQRYFAHVEDARPPEHIPGNVKR